MSEKKDNRLQIPVCDNNQINSYAEYKAVWEKLPSLQIKMVEKNESCKHNLGDYFVYKNPYAKPPGVCTALLHVLELYVWRVTLGFPSWNEADHNSYLVHCPDKKGTVWELKRIPE